MNEQHQRELDELQALADLAHDQAEAINNPQFQTAAMITFLELIAAAVTALLRHVYEKADLPDPSPGVCGVVRDPSPLGGAGSTPASGSET